MDRIGDVRTRNSKVDNDANEVTIASGIRKRVTVRGTKLKLSSIGVTMVRSSPRVARARRS